MTGLLDTHSKTRHVRNAFYKSSSGRSSHFKRCQHPFNSCLEEGIDIDLRFIQFLDEFRLFVLFRLDFGQEIAFVYNLGADLDVVPVAKGADH